MTAHTAPTDTRYIHARWAVAIGIGIAVVGSVVGVVFGVMLGDASGPESWLIIGGLVLSALLLALLIRKPDDATSLISALASLYFVTYLCAGFLIVMPLADFIRLLPYLLWFYPLLAFNRFTNFGRYGELVDRVITFAPPILFLIAAFAIFGKLQAMEIGAAAIFLLSFLSYAFFLNLFARYRESVAISIERSQELERTTEALRQSEEKFRRLFDVSNTGMGAIDADGRIQWANRAFPAMLDEAAVKGRSFIDNLHREDRDRWQAGMFAAASGESQAFFFEGRLAVRRDRPLFFEGSFVRAPAVGALPEAMIFVCQDVTDRREFYARTAQSQKLEAVGQLTGGIAHDFNNLLTVILGNATTLEEMAIDPDQKQLAELTRRAAERGAALTHRLLAFSRRQALEARATDVNRLIGDMDGLLRRTLGGSVDIRMALADGVWPALIDGPQLENAVLNLSINARDAMPSGGKLIIETANRQLDEAYAALHVDLAAGQYVMVAVSDTGSGMDAATLARAFEPFFTTKDVGKGTGLGLSMVYGFVSQSRGHVEIYSEPGQGTTIKLYLPRADADADSVSAPATAAAAPRGEETILVVEDDDLVRENVCAQLRSLGYDVVAVRSGAAAIDALRQSRHFDLLFTDVVMPGGMNGAQLAAEARKVRPDITVLFTSGYTENAVLHHGQYDGGVRLLNKPYRLQDLAQKVRAVLDA